MSHTYVETFTFPAVAAGSEEVIDSIARDVIALHSYATYTPHGGEALVTIELGNIGVAVMQSAPIAETFPVAILKPGQPIRIRVNAATDCKSVIVVLMGRRP